MALRSLYVSVELMFAAVTIIYRLSGC